MVAAGAALAGQVCLSLSANHAGVVLPISHLRALVLADALALDRGYGADLAQVLQEQFVQLQLSFAVRPLLALLHVHRVLFLDLPPVQHNVDQVGLGRR